MSENEDQKEARRKMLERDMELAIKVGRFREKTRKGSAIRLKVLERNMEPTIQLGDIVEVKNVSLVDLKLGDLVIYRHGETFLVRRITKIYYEEGDMCFLVKADATGKLESALPASQVMGKVMSLERRGERIVISKEAAVDLSGISPVLNRVMEAATEIFGKMMQAIDKALKR